jgi:peptidoglycan/LPS O-acetylase OafA/YrhL
MALDVPLTSALTSTVVGVFALGLAALAWRARRRSANRQLTFVAAAFLLFAARSAFSAYNVTTHFIVHDYIELYLSLFDLAILVLLLLPLLVKR